MGESAFIYVLIPAGYGVFFVALLLTTIVVSFSRTRRAAAPCLLAGTLMTIPGIAVGWLLCILFIQLQNQLWESDISADGLKFVLMFVPFIVALASVTLSFWAGARLVLRRRDAKRLDPSSQNQ